MRKSKLHIAHKSLFAIGAAFIVALFFVQTNLLAEGGTQVPQCAGAYLISPQEGQVVDGVTDLEVYVDPTVGPSQVKFVANGTFVGEASNSTTNSDNVYRYSWTPSSYYGSQVEIYAKLFFNNTATGSHNYPDGYCVTQKRTVEVQGEATTYDLRLKFETVLGPNQTWTGPVNTNKTFKVIAQESINGSEFRNVTEQTQLHWQTTIGTIQKGTLGRANFFTGPKSGVGKIKVIASKNSETVYRYINVNVSQPETVSTYPADGEIEEKETSTAETSTQTTTDTQEQEKKYSLGDADLENCIVEKLGEDVRKKLNEGYRLRLSEIRLVKACLAATSNVLPPTLAPVAPEKVQELKETKIAEINNIKEATLADARKGIQLSGKAKPNSEVLLYVFSEPLVLTTTADEEGNWTYTLDTPLEPGDHEVFVAVEDDDGEVVRSSGFNFSVAQVAATEDNPQGLSLALVGQQESETSRLVGLSLVVVLVGVLVSVTLLALKNKKHHHPDMKPEKHGVSGKA